MRNSIMELHPISVWDGPAIHILNLIKGFKKIGQDVFLVTSDWEGTTLADEECEVYKLHCKRPDRFDYKYIFTIAKLIKEKNVDIVHTHGGFNSWIGILATKIAGRGKVVNTWHGLRKVPDNLIHRWFYKEIGGIISVSQMLKDRIINHSYLDPESISVIHNATDIEKYSERPKNDIRKNLAIPSDSFVIGFFGRIHPDKGVEYAIKAVSLLPKDKDIYLFLVGWNSDQEYCVRAQQLVDQLGLKDRVIFCGYTTDVLSYMSSIDVLLLPSVFREPCALVIGEAMACKKAIITTNNGGQKEVVEDTITGYIIDPCSEHQIAEKIIALEADRDLCLKMGMTGRKVVENNYTLDIMAQKTVDTFNHFLNC